MINHPWIRLQAVCQYQDSDQDQLPDYLDHFPHDPRNLQEICEESTHLGPCVPGNPFDPYITANRRHYLQYTPGRSNGADTMIRGEVLYGIGGLYLGAFEVTNHLFSLYERSSRYPFYTFTPFTKLGDLDGLQLRLADNGLFVESPERGTSRQIARFTMPGRADSLMLILDKDGLLKVIAIYEAPDGWIHADLVWQTTPQGRHQEHNPPLLVPDSSLLFKVVAGYVDPLAKPPLSQEDTLTSSDVPSANDMENISDLVEIYTLTEYGERVETVVKALCPGFLDAPGGLPADCLLYTNYTQLIEVDSVVAEYVYDFMVDAFDVSLAVPNPKCYVSSTAQPTNCSLEPTDPWNTTDSSLPSTVFTSSVSKLPAEVSAAINSDTEVGLLAKVECANSECPPGFPLSGGHYFLVEDPSSTDGSSFWALSLKDETCVRSHSATSNRCPIVTNRDDDGGLVTVTAVAPSFRLNVGQPQVSSSFMLNRCRRTLNFEAIIGFAPNSSSPLTTLEQLELQADNFLRWDCTLNSDAFLHFGTAQANRMALAVKRWLITGAQLLVAVALAEVAPQLLAATGFADVAAFVRFAQSQYFAWQAIASMGPGVIQMFNTCPAVSDFATGDADYVDYGDCAVAALMVWLNAKMIHHGTVSADTFVEVMKNPGKSFQDAIFAASKGSVQRDDAEDFVNNVISEAGQVKDYTANQQELQCR